MKELTAEDYIYIESISLLLSYYRTPKENLPRYADLIVKALEIATSKDSMHSSLFNELIAQDAIALQIGDNPAIQPDKSMYNVLHTLFTYAGDLNVDIIINIEDFRIKLMSTAISKLLVNFQLPV